MSTGVAGIIARSRKRGEARYGTVEKEEESVEEDWPAGWLSGKGRKEERSKKKEGGGKERNGSLRHDL